MKLTTLGRSNKETFAAHLLPDDEQLPLISVDDVATRGGFGAKGGAVREVLVETHMCDLCETRGDAAMAYTRKGDAYLCEDCLRSLAPEELEVVKLTVSLRGVPL